MKFPHLRGKIFGIAAIAAFAAVALFAATPQPAHAQAEWLAGLVANQVATSPTVAKVAQTAAAVATGGSGIISEIGTSVITAVAFAINWIVASIFGILIAIEAWIITVVLQINASILQTTLVQTGFSVTLSIVNLLFVLGIIVVAISTILRNESYGIKSILWKLIVMAILVNFGLVIMAPIFGFGNGLTQYFLNCIDPTAGCNNSGGLGTYANFATQFAGSFSPQDSMGLLNDQGSAVKGYNAVMQGNANGAASALGSGAAQQLVPIFGIFLVALNLILVTCVLGAFIILLFVRYLYIAILAILLPFAWASYVFPSFSKHWSQWWNNFLRWTFFAPIVMFFIYLAIVAMRGGSAGTASLTVATYTSDSTNPILGPLSSFFGSAFAGILSPFLQEIIFAGLIIGGMIAANSMGIKLAGTAVDMGKKGAKWTAGRYGGKSARWAWSKMGGEEKTKKLMAGGGIGEGRIGRNIRKIPILGNLAVEGGRRAASLAGEQIHHMETNKKLVDDYKKGMPKDKASLDAMMQGSQNDQKRLAAIATGIEEGHFDNPNQEVMMGGKPVKLKDIIDDEHLLALNGQEDIKKKANKLWGSDGMVRDGERLEEAAKSGRGGSFAAEKELKDADGNVIIKKGEIVNAADILKPLDALGRTFTEIARDQYMGTLERSDVAKLAQSTWEKKSGDALAKQKEFLRSLFRTLPEAMPSAIAKMKSPALKNIQQIYPTIIKEEQEKVAKQQMDIAMDPSLSKAEKDKRLAPLNALSDHFDGIKKDFEHALANNGRFAAMEASAAAAPPTPAPGGHP